MSDFLLFTHENGTRLHIRRSWFGGVGETGPRQEMRQVIVGDQVQVVPDGDPQPSVTLVAVQFLGLVPVRESVAAVLAQFEGRTPPNEIGVIRAGESGDEDGY